MLAHCMRMENTLSGKYDSLKDDTGEDITGVWFVDGFFSALHDGERVTIIRGYLECPDCDNILEWRYLKSLWYCDSCRHAWDSESIVEITRKEGSIMAETLTKEEMDANAAEAKDELLEMSISQEEIVITEIAAWWKKHLMKCGHKRLGRIILQFQPAEGE